MPTLSDDLACAKPGAEQKDVPSLTVMTGDRTGMRIRLGSTDLVVGRSSDAGVHLADASLSRRHARFFRVDDQVYVQDLKSTNGTFVGGKRVVSPVALQDGDQVQLGANRVLLYNLTSTTEDEAARRLYETAVKDPTSGAFNRRHFDSRLETEKAFAEHSGAPIALLLIDIDEFKQVNDAHGHVLGDSVLLVLAASVQRMLKPNDTLVRYGGDEFVVLCRDTTLRNGLILAERIRAEAERLPFSVSGNELHITVSVGVASGRSSDGAWATLVESADRAMFRAKGDGRNLVAAAHS